MAKFQIRRGQQTFLCYHCRVYRRDAAKYDKYDYLLIPANVVLNT